MPKSWSESWGKSWGDAWGADCNTWAKSWGDSWGKSWNLCPKPPVEKDEFIDGGMALVMSAEHKQRILEDDKIILESIMSFVREINQWH